MFTVAPSFVRLPFPGWLTTALVIMAILWLASIRQKRRAMRNQQRICRACADANPPYARFCRRCGKSLE